MVSYFVRYRGAARDPEEFHAYYAGQHAGVLRHFPRIRSLVLHRPAVASDPFPVRAGDTFLLAQMQFDSVGDLDAALRSPARQKAREDFSQFPQFTGEITHEAMLGKVIF
jgi:uncharacterized protein (TIGR02118 family)